MSEFSNLECAPLTIESFNKAIGASLQTDADDENTIATYRKCFGCPMRQRHECAGTKDDIAKRHKGLCKMFEGESVENSECGASAFQEKMLDVFSNLLPELESFVALYADGMQRRNRANFDAHIAYTTRNGKRQ